VTASTRVFLFSVTFNPSYGETYPTGAPNKLHAQIRAVDYAAAYNLAGDLFSRLRIGFPAARFDLTED
jgi:hypothetical protein